MSLGSLLAACLVATTAFALGASLPPGDDFRCGSVASAELEAMSKQFALQEAQASAHSRRGSNIEVDVYMHVVTGNETSDYIGDDTLVSQLRVLNADFAPSGISFTLKGISRSAHAAWARPADALAMQRSLRRGSYRALNLYVLPSLWVFGYCSYPRAVQNGSPAFFADGCVLRADTLPGGALRDFNLGRTATHEVGHWFGLAHTFEGGCAGGGDYIDDTPAQESASRGCPLGRDSCREQPGLDPIHNFMDYSHDACYSEFTPRQAQRMMSFWAAFRA